MKGRAPTSEPWRDRLLDQLSSYLPLLSMTLLALGSWWLVSETPVPEPQPKPGPLRHVADYSMTGFTVQRFGPDGRLVAELSGELARHFPDTRTLEIDRPRVRVLAADGSVTEASARQAVSSDDAQWVDLRGQARVTRQLGGQPPVEFAGEQLHADLQRDRFTSAGPVRLTQAGATWTAAGFEYDHGSQRIELAGPIRAVLPPARR